jgi:hypothetical protein
MDGAFLDWALEAFAGYVAADALSAGPDGVRSAVDNRQYKRRLSAVLEPEPTHDDIKTVLGRLQGALAARDLARKGSTTAGSALYPEPSRAVSLGRSPISCAPAMASQPWSTGS